MFTLVIYALFKDYKRNSLDAMAKATHTDYQKFQYFFSDFGKVISKIPFLYSAFTWSNFTDAGNPTDLEKLP